MFNHQHKNSKWKQLPLSHINSPINAHLAWDVVKKSSPFITLVLKQPGGQSSPSPSHLPTVYVWSVIPVNNLNLLPSQMTVQQQANHYTIQDVLTFDYIRLEQESNGFFVLFKPLQNAQCTSLTGKAIIVMNSMLPNKEHAKTKFTQAYTFFIWYL